MDKLIITLIGFGTIGLIYWFFFGKKESTSHEGQHEHH